jgi:hypothetical protein
MIICSGVIHSRQNDGQSPSGPINIGLIRRQAFRNNTAVNFHHIPNGDDMYCVCVCVCVCVWSLESGDRFCVFAFGRNLASVAVNMFPHLIQLKRHFINFVLSMRYAKIMLQ